MTTWDFTKRPPEFYVSECNLFMETVRMIDAGITNGAGAKAKRINKARQILRKELKMGLTKDMNCNYLLCHAVALGRVNVVRLLLELGETDVNANIQGINPLVNACWAGHTDIVALLLEQKDIDVNIKGAKPCECPPILNAAANGHVEIMQMLLKDPRVDVNIRTPKGLTALHKAAEEGHEGCTENVALLLACEDIQVNPITHFEWTPLTMAISRRRIVAVRHLLKHTDINVNFVGSEESWKAPLHMAILARDARAVKLLLECEGIDVNVRLPLDPELNYKGGEEGATPLYEAAKCGGTECVRLLLACESVDVNAACPTGATPLFVASFKGHADVVKLLLDYKGIDLDAKETKLGITAFTMACYAGNIKVVKVFLNSAHELDVDEVQMGLKEGMTQLLLRAGIKVLFIEKFVEIARLLTGHMKCFKIPN